jgi:hypothetical protein
MKIALACAMIALVSSAAFADDSGLPHWKPDKATIAKLDFAFRNAGFWDGSPPDIKTYNRYYAGVTIKSRRMVRAEFTEFPDVEFVDGKVEYHADKNPVHIVPDVPLLGDSDGGCAVVNMLYDVDAERMVWLHCNSLG